jgi:hypothetical protein
MAARAMGWREKRGGRCTTQDWADVLLVRA